MDGCAHVVCHWLSTCVTRVQAGAKVMLLGTPDPRLLAPTHPLPAPPASTGAPASRSDVPPSGGDGSAAAGAGLAGGGGLTRAQLNAERMARAQAREVAAVGGDEEAGAPGLGWGGGGGGGGGAAGGGDTTSKKKKKKEMASGGGSGEGAAGAQEQKSKRKSKGHESMVSGDEGCEEEDVDALLARLDMNRGIHSCGFAKCGAEAVEMLGTTCAHCRLRSDLPPLSPPASSLAPCLLSCLLPPLSPPAAALCLSL